MRKILQILEKVDAIKLAELEKARKEGHEHNLRLAQKSLVVHKKSYVSPSNARRLVHLAESRKLRQELIDAGLIKPLEGK